MNEHFNRLTPAEHERLAILMEEMAEAIAIGGKILRHGYDSYNPFDEHCTTNRVLLQEELADVMQAIEMLSKSGDINQTSLLLAIEARSKHPKGYTHHQEG